MRRNYKSDFHFIMKLYAQVRKEDGTIEKREVFWPEHDWTARLYTSIGLNAYIVSRKGDVLTNCFNDNGRIHVVCNNHRLGKGRLQCEFHAEIPNGLYPDGIEDLYEPQLLDIELVAGQGDCATQAEVNLILPYIKGDEGAAFTYSDFTSEQKAELIAPINESIDKAITDKQDKLRVTEDFDLSENLLSFTEAGKTALFDSMWASIGGTKLDNGRYRMGATGKELTIEEAMVRYERNWFIKLWNAACANRFVTSSYYKPSGQYNESTGYFELNGITDIGIEEAIRIYSAYVSGRTTTGYRTNIPVGMQNYQDAAAEIRMFTNTQVEKICGYFTAVNAEVLNTNTLKEINAIRIGYGSNSINIQSTSLEIIYFSAQNAYHYSCTIRIPNAANFRLDGIAQIVKWVSNSTVTVHRDVYAKLTGDTTNAAAAALSEEEFAQWREMAVSAAEYNITFATT